MEILRISFQNLGKSSQNSGRSCFDAAVSLGVSESLSLSLSFSQESTAEVSRGPQVPGPEKKVFSLPNLWDRYTLFTPVYFLLCAWKPQSEVVFWKMD